jgi:hypothetical protein
VTTDGKIKGPAAPFSNLVISAAWTSRTVTPTRRFRLWGDVALLFFGRGDLGAANVQNIYHGTVDTTQTITKFGRGYAAYAYSTGIIELPWGFTTIQEGAAALACRETHPDQAEVLLRLQAYQVLADESLLHLAYGFVLSVNRADAGEYACRGDSASRFGRAEAGQAGRQRGAAANRSAL